MSPSILTVWLSVPGHSPLRQDRKLGSVPFLCSLQCSHSSKMSNRGPRDDSMIKSAGCSSRGPGLIHMQAHKGLRLQFEGTRCSLLTSAGTRHVCGTQTRRQNTCTHKTQTNKQRTTIRNGLSFAGSQSAARGTRPCVGQRCPRNV